LFGTGQPGLAEYEPLAGTERLHDYVTGGRWTGRGRALEWWRTGSPSVLGLFRGLIAPGSGSSLAVVADNSLWTIRAATAQDGSFLADMLLEAVNWSPEWKKKTLRQVLADPKTAHYIAGWPSDTDLGVIAEVDREPAGAAWLRFLPASDPGYGFVSPDIPELTVGVAARWRGQGIGRALLRAVAEQAKQAGIQQISLSVERKNFAQHLYLSEGYQIIDSADSQSDTMVKDLL
jgi:ribosomal protein S18 acetylase RimI-like enzyme